MRGAALVCLALTCAGCAVPAARQSPAAPLVVLGEADGAVVGYLGSAACGACHAAAYERWRGTGHAREFTGLPAADRRVTACLRCHVTGYGDRFGFRSGGDGPDLAHVGCEACHGAGADHGRSAHPELVPTRTGGECPPCEINRICRLCHTPERSPGFDLARDLPPVTCKP